ncbi:hypothetical protein GOV09_00080 [Candidatus Woesearchaeota archaeon]|nr:hypothetical protein [Candidatus Woesearchaeota archaeon]
MSKVNVVIGDGEIRYYSDCGAVSQKEFQEDFARRDNAGEISDIVEEEGNIITAIKLCEDEVVVRRLTTKYTDAVVKDSPTWQSIYHAGVARWGALVGAEDFVIAFEIKKNYAFAALIEEMSNRPKDGVLRTRDVYTGAYSTRVEVKGWDFGMKSGFGVVYKIGRDLYGDQLTAKIAKEAFKFDYPFQWQEHYGSLADAWFKELSA